MLQQLSKKRKGAFTLVEIMIVVAIIALLASMALPSLQRARQRTQATTIKEELRLVEAAVAQYATEKNLKKAAPVTFADIKDHLKAGSKLADGGGTDSIGNTITLTTVEAGPKVNAATITEFTDVVADDFWGSYDPSYTPPTTGGGAGGGAGGGEGGGEGG